MTASGAVAGFLALEAATSGHIRRALLWLVVCQVLDAVDGPIARKLDVTLSAPEFDGHILDLVVDYVTCVVVPAVLLINLRLTPHHLGIALVAAILMSSALWFARVDQETEDGWFRGFPGMWNIVIPTFIVLHTGPLFVTIVCIAGCLLQLSNIEIPHLIRAREMRKVTLALLGVYFAAFVTLSTTYPSGNQLLRLVVLVLPLYLAVLAVWRHRYPDLEIRGQRIKRAD